jgi:hypothetical protein
VNWWDLDSLGQLWFAAENKIGGKYDDWECTNRHNLYGTYFCGISTHLFYTKPFFNLNNEF